MAAKILGIDVGSYSVKVIVATSGFRQVTLDAFHERIIPAGDDPIEKRAHETLAEILKDNGLKQEAAYSTLPGHMVSMRVIEFGFSGLKRADLDKAVGAELEALLPHDLDDIVYDFDSLPKDVGKRRMTGEMTAAEPSKDTHASTHVLAAATTREHVETLLAAYNSEGIDQARSILAAPTVYARAVAKVAAAQVAKDEGVLVIDHGHRRTNLCVVTHGKTVFARTLSRGGYRVTKAIAKAWSLPFADAERAKHTDGFVASTNNPSQSTTWGRISEVVTDELTPLVREVRQTLAACRAQVGVQPSLVLLCGGGGRLRGLREFLEEKLQLNVIGVGIDDAPAIVGPGDGSGTATADTALVAHGTMLEGLTGRPLFDLRQGGFSYRSDFTFLRQRAGFMAAAALVLIALAAGNAYAALYKLRKEEAFLEIKLRRETTSLFGKPVSAEDVQKKLSPKKIKSPLPKMTAFDQLVAISRVLPASDKLTLDIREIDIRPQTVRIDNASTDTAAAMETIEKKLKEIECFDEFTPGKVRNSQDKVQFSLTISTECM